MSGRAAVHSAVPVSAGLAKPAVVAVPVHRVTDRRAKCTPEQSHFAEHRPGDRAFEWIVGHSYKASDPAGFSVAWDKGRDCIRYQTIMPSTGDALPGIRGPFRCYFSTTTIQHEQRSTLLRQRGTMPSDPLRLS